MYVCKLFVCYLDMYVCKTKQYVHIVIAKVEFLTQLDIKKSSHGTIRKKSVMLPRWYMICEEIRNKVNFVSFIIIISIMLFLC